jgi:hypothetical protein
VQDGDVHEIAAGIATFRAGGLVPVDFQKTHVPSTGAASFGFIICLCPSSLIYIWPC